MSALRWESDGLTWPHMRASRFVQVSSIRWHVQEMGNGPTCLLVHGTGASSHSWRDLMPILARQFRVVAMDLPGHGFTQPVAASQLTIPAMATALAELVHNQNIEPAFVVGHSAGSAILARMALDGHLNNAVIFSVNGALLPFAGLARDLFPALARLLFLNPFVPSFFAWRANDVRVVRRLIADTGSNISEEGVLLYARLFRSSSHVAAALGMMANWDLNALAKDLPKLPTPLYLLASSGDRAIPPDIAFKVRDLVPGSTVVILRGLGHLAHEEKPDDVADAILQNIKPEQRRTCL